MLYLQGLQEKLQKALRARREKGLLQLQKLKSDPSARGKLFVKGLLHWFSYSKRNLPWRNESDLYKLLIAEKLLQQTDVGHVLPVYHKFFEKFPTLQTLALASQPEIEEVLKPLGFWRIRARDLKMMAMQLANEHGGIIPTDKELLLDLYGVGRYIATAFSCFALGHKEAIVDVNVRRVAKRIFFWSSDLPDDKELEKFIAKIVPIDIPKEFNWALLDFSAKVCTRKPHCDRCFANNFCQYWRSESEMKSAK